MDDASGHGSYVKKVRAATQQYVQELLQDNDRLAQVAAAAQTDRDSLQRDNLRLREQVLALREERDRFEDERKRMQRHLSELESDRTHFASEFATVEIQNNNLANLYVASYRLHSTLDRAEVIAAIEEIVINLIGSEELAIFELSKNGSSLELIGSFGIDTQTWSTVPLGLGIIGSCAADGSTWIAGKSPAAEPTSGERHLTACIPMKLEDRVIGAIAIFRLLPQKANTLVELDLELFDLLATHSATALYCTTLHNRLAQSPSLEVAP